jgi:hypothetical protein
MPHWLSLYIANAALLFAVFPCIILLGGNYTEMGSVEGARSRLICMEMRLKRRVRAALP